MTGDGPVYVSEGVGADLECIKPGLIGGSAGCNGYSAAYFLDNGEISIGIPTRTTIACLDDEKMQVEDEFLKRLDNVSTAYISGGKLVFADSKGNEMLVFLNSGKKPEWVITGHMADPGDVTGYTWYLYADRERSSIDGIPEGAEITLIFGDDGRFYGISGCNNYSGDYKLESGKLELENGKFDIGLIGMIPMPCAAEDVMILESVYFEKLDQVEGAYVDGDRLFLLNENGVEVLSFEKRLPEGVEWHLIGYMGSDGMMDSVYDDAGVTLMMEDGRAAGNAGCNSYFGDYETDDKGNLTFGMIGMTEMYCEGKMDLESRYLSLLGETSGYSINSGIMALTDPKGDTILLFL